MPVVSSPAGTSYLGSEPGSSKKIRAKAKAKAKAEPDASHPDQGGSEKDGGEHSSASTPFWVGEGRAPRRSACASPNRNRRR